MGRRPNISNQTIQSILHQHYHIKPKQIHSLEAFDDFNAHIIADNEYVFKATARDTMQELEFQNAVMKALQGHVPVPALVPTKRGEEILEEGDLRIRLLTYLPGEPIANLPWNQDLLFQVGESIGKMDVHLAGFQHSRADREVIWDIRNFERILQYFQPTPEEEQHVQGLFAAFRKKVLPAYATMQKCIIHNDAHQYNILSTGGTITGIIDFQDTVLSYPVNNLAISLAHFMSTSTDPLDTAVAVFRGYHSQRTLNDIEKKILPILVQIRAATVFIGAQSTLRRDPDNGSIRKWITTMHRLLDWLCTHPDWHQKLQASQQEIQQDRHQ